MNVTIRGQTRHYRTVAFDAEQNAVLLIEQRLLPHEFKIVATRDFRETARAIKDMIVRGAGRHRRHRRLRPGPGRARLSRQRPEEIFRAHRNRLPNPQSRPAHRRGSRQRHESACAPTMRAGETVEEQQALALAAAEEFANEDVRHCADIGEHGAKLIRNGMNVLTHCNAGWLAFVDIGSATAPDVRRAGAGQKISRLSATKPAPAPRAPP